jgi:hypothetical protein
VIPLAGQKAFLPSKLDPRSLNHPPNIEVAMTMVDDDPTWADSEMRTYSRSSLRKTKLIAVADALSPAEDIEMDKQPIRGLQAVPVGPNLQVAQDDVQDLQTTRPDVHNDGPKLDPIGTKYYMVKRLDINGHAVNIEVAQRTEAWYDRLDMARRREVGFWNAQMVPPFPMHSKNVKDEALKEYTNVYFVSHPQFVHSKYQTPQDSECTLDGQHS